MRLFLHRRLGVTGGSCVVAARFSSHIAVRVVSDLGECPALRVVPSPGCVRYFYIRVLAKISLHLGREDQDLQTNPGWRGEPIGR